jgi:hypothetical protein
LAAGEALTAGLMLRIAWSLSEGDPLIQQRYRFARAALHSAQRREWAKYVTNRPAAATFRPWRSNVGTSVGTSW